MIVADRQRMTEADLIRGRGMTLAQFDRALRFGYEPTAPGTHPSRDLSVTSPSASVRGRIEAPERVR